MNADGHQNFPDGEVFTSPVEVATHGHIAFSLDAPYNGNDVAGVRLWFEQGKVVREEATKGERFLSQMLDMDEGARYLGEVAFGLNDEIQHGHARHALRREDRRHVPRRARAWRSPRPAAATARACTGTWCATCARAARCTATATDLPRRAVPVSDPRVQRLAQVVDELLARASARATWC